jgi:hypothetical protein
MLRDFALSFFLYPFYFLIIFIFSSNKIHAQSSFDIILVQVPIYSFGRHQMFEIKSIYLTVLVNTYFTY